MDTVFILIGAFAVQVFLAFITASDAQERGHNAASWFFFVMLFGVLMVLIYLITRNDRRLPESERPKNNVELPTKYIIITVIGVIAFSFVGWVIASMMYPLPACEYQTTDLGGEECVWDGETLDKRIEQKNNRGNLIWGFFFTGAILSPASWYWWNEHR